MTETALQLQRLAREKKNLQEQIARHQERLLVIEKIEGVLKPTQPSKS